MKLLTYVEIDVPDWASGSPAADDTYRFAKNTNYLPSDIDAIPSIKDVSFSPATVSLGENIGERASLSVVLKDHRHVFNGESFTSGTFWGKWRARYGTKLRGRPIRWYKGYLGQSLAEMEVRHFIIDSTSGPTPDGTYVITAKDILKFADDDRSQAPLLSNGFITSGITSSSTSITLSPTGIGDAEYPASGYVAIGGTEICSFTRVANVLTVTRGQLNTTAVAHDSGERAQLVLTYTSEDPANIISDLLQNYAGVDAAYIPITAWLAETEAFLQTLYSATISEPTSVKKLISELIQQAALAVWWEPSVPQIRLKVLRKIATDAELYNDDNLLQGSLSTAENPDARVSQVWTYFGQRNSLRPVDEPDNYRSVALTANLEAETEYGGSAIKIIYSRWIPFGGRSIALRLNDLILSRFTNPPRKVSFSLWRHGTENPQLGGGYQLGAWPFQLQDGTLENIPIQITRLNPTDEAYQIEAEEMLAGEILPTDLTNRTIIIDGSLNNLNLKTLHDSIYPDITGTEDPPVNLTVYIEEGVIIGSDSPTETALTVGAFYSSLPLTIYVRGRIQGAGGAGGAAEPYGGYNGEDGGLALYTRKTLTLVLNEGQGEVWGGGGGGGGGRIKESGKIAGSGGGGAGTQGGLPGAAASEGNMGEPGTDTAGGAGGPNSTSSASPGGAGGDPAMDGSGTNVSGYTSSGGVAGGAIDGLSYITKTGTGDIRGTQVN